MIEIPLTQGKVALIDDADASLVQEHKWCAHKSRHTYYAATHIRRDGKDKLIHMHRLILGAKEGQETDHINHNGLDNRRKNIRLCTTQENQRNQRRRSRYKGVDKTRGKWQALIQIDKGCRKYLGRFDTALEAARAYNDAAIKYHGEFASLNDLEDTDESDA